MLINNRIAFIKMGTFSHTNESVLTVLKDRFPNYTIDIIDIWDDIVKITSFKNFFYAFLEYGLTMFISKKRILACLVKNKYIFNKVKKDVNSKLKDKNYAFTFQTQSLFDTSIADTPNFMYTDHTYLVNKHYPTFDRNDLRYFENWIELEKTIYQNAQMNLTMSSNIKNSIIHDYNILEKKVECIYAGSNVLIDDNRNISTDKYKSKNILFVGINWERKGGPTLIKAFEIVLKKYPEATLTIVGCSPEVSISNCTIIGKVPLSEVQQHYEKASIFCLPTTLEPFGMVFIEAINNKLPLVATKIGAIPDFIKEEKNGYMVEPGDYVNLANKLSILLKSSNKCEEFANYGYENIL